MNKKVLFVDDDEKVLATFRRNLVDSYSVHTASGADEAMQTLALKRPFAAVVSDLKMPGTDGIAFLAQVRKKYPDTVRVMLTGFADLEAAVAAVNEDQVFRFLTKPCDTRRLGMTLDAAIEQYRLITSERELLQGTLRGSIKMLTEVLSMLKPEVWGAVSRVIPYVKKLSMELEDPKPWQTETAARLAHIGYIILPEKLINRIYAGRQLSMEEIETYARHPQVAANLISNIPRMGALANIITYQDKNYDGSGLPFDSLRKKDIPLGSRILKVAFDFDILLQSKNSAKKDALAEMRRRTGFYDENVLAALERVLGDEAKYRIITVPVSDLSTRMILMEDIFLTRGGKRIKVLSRGQEISDMAKEYLRKYLAQGYIGQSAKVVQPMTEPSDKDEGEKT